LLDSADRVLKFDYRGAPQTVSVMRDAALASQEHIAVRRVAEEICQGLASKDYASEYLAIYYFILARCRYMRDPRTVELVKAPYILATDILAGKTPSIDCDDMAALIAALILAVGGKCDMVTVAFKNQFFRGERQYSHVFCRAQEPRTGEYVVLDPVSAEKTNDMISRIKAAKVWAVA
jgi:hypothetical protein